MAVINSITIDVENNVIKFFIPVSQLPETEYCEECIKDQVHKLYGDSISTFLSFTVESREVCIYFPPEDYIALAEHLHNAFSYTLKQARSIIRWIENNVAAKHANLIWSTTYLEILENAHDPN